MCFETEVVVLVDSYSVYVRAGEMMCKSASEIEKSSCLHPLALGGRDGFGRRQRKHDVISAALA
jgi:hypothetical protein